VPQVLVPVDRDKDFEAKVELSKPVKTLGTFMGGLFIEITAATISTEPFSGVHCSTNLLIMAKHEAGCFSLRIPTEDTIDFFHRWVQMELL
jgi:hypothetical protein